MTVKKILYKAILYKAIYNSPIGELILMAENSKLVGLWFTDSKYFPADTILTCQQKDLDVFAKTKHWLDIYFSGKKPNFTPELSLYGTTFQKEVWSLLCEIQYGQTTTYANLAKLIAKKHNIKKMAAQAIGGAVGRNPISIIVPCHRVIGSNGSLTGYAAGISKKTILLDMESK